MRVLLKRAGWIAGLVALGALLLLLLRTGPVNGYVSLQNDRLARLNSNGTVETGTALNPSAQIAVKYSPTRSVDLLCSLRYQSRSTGSDLSRPYSGTVVLCSGELMLK